MPSLYFCQPHAQNQGMLRAIVSIDDCQYLVARDKMTYVGEQFPKVYQGSKQSADFAVLSVDASEVQGEWQAGYYRIEADLMKLNQQLLTLAR
jgi:hypothetical protein